MSVSLTANDLSSLRRAIAEGLPSVDHAGAQSQQIPALTYVPPSHAKALDPESSVVEGIRGAGKSFWWAALSSDEHRKFVVKAFPDVHLNPSMIVHQGFGDASGSVDAPSKDVLAKLFLDFNNPRAIWRAVLAHKLNFPIPFPQQAQDGQGVWSTRTAWVTDNPELFDDLLMGVDTGLQRDGKTAMVLFDALDRLAETWQDIRPLARGLLQVAQDMRATRCIRLKIFVRPDMLEDKAIVGFPDASKLLARRANLNWRKVDLYALFFQCLGNAKKAGGESFRSLTKQTLALTWQKTDDLWLIPKELCGDEELQENLFQALAGKAMSASPTGLKRGKPYKWVVNHLQDGRDQVSPRSFCEALRQAAEKSMSDFETYELPLHFKSIQAGVQAASGIRVNELVHEDYPWVEHVMTPLRGELTVPCFPKDISAIWKRHEVLDNLSDALNDSSNLVKLPPQHLSDGYEGVLLDLMELGLIQRLSDGRIQMPDVYRIAFGLGRRGGVKPLK
ncbi:MAG: hypothetical protein IPK02_16360 [Candidatus Accumulibacter sp.]|uniref:Uncharacterized protein n=1 Tax=Candidatus Accumulibacter affinis TaxID=2954384 RepID=A0A935TB59_9PROT|nr:hypothetical protein [Candidatus Accumulibacter affinis]